MIYTSEHKVTRSIFSAVSRVELDFLLIDVFSVTYSEHEDISFQNGIDYPVVTDAIFPKTCELSFKNWMGVSFFRQFFLDLI